MGRSGLQQCRDAKELCPMVERGMVQELGVLNLQSCKSC